MWNSHPDRRSVVPTLPHVPDTKTRPARLGKPAWSGRAIAVCLGLLCTLSSIHALGQAGPDAPDAETTPQARLTQVSGDFSVSYAFPVLGSAAAPNAGPLVRANLSFLSQGRTVTLGVDPFGLRSQSVSLQVSEDDEALSLEYTRTPGSGATPGDGARTDVQAVLVAKPEGAPTVQALLASQQVAGAADSLTVIARIALSDRYRDPYAGVSSIDWRASVQTSTTRTGTGAGAAAAASERSTTTSGFGVRAAFGGERSRSYRPTLDVDWSVNHAGGGSTTPTAAHAVRLRSGLGIDVTAHEVVSLAADWDLREAHTGTTQSLSVSSDRLAPLRLTASVGRSSASGSGVGAGAFTWSLDGDAPLGSLFTVGAGYRGESDVDGSGHGARFRFGVRSRSAGLTLRANLEAGGMWRTDMAFRPTAGMTLAATTPDDAPLSFTVSASVKYDQRLAVAAAAALAVRTGALSVALDAKVDYASALTLSGGATAAYDLFVIGDDRLGVQVGFEGVTTAGGTSAASVDLGLRYSFGGDR